MYSMMVFGAKNRENDYRFSPGFIVSVSGSGRKKEEGEEGKVPAAPKIAPKMAIQLNTRSATRRSRDWRRKWERVTLRTSEMPIMEQHTMKRGWIFVAAISDINLHTGTSRR